MSFIAKQPNGLYCRFNTITDCPDICNMTEEDYIEYCKKKAEDEARHVLDKYTHPFECVINNFTPTTNMTQKEFDEFLAKVGYNKDGI